MPKQSRKDRFLELTEGLWSDNRCVISSESQLKELAKLSKQFKTETLSDTLTVVLGLAFTGESLELESNNQENENTLKPDNPNHKRFHLDDGY